MKIAILLFFRAPHGGLHDNIHATATRLLSNGHEVTVISPPGPFQDILKREGIPTLDLAPNAGDDMAFDLIHAHPGESRVLGQRLAKRLNAPLFVTFHGAWIDHIQFYHRECVGILTVSAAVRAKVISVAPEAASKIAIMPNAVDFTRIGEASRAADDGRLRVIVASRFDIDKKRLVETLIALWREQSKRAVDTVSWELAGDGTMLAEMRDEARLIFGDTSPVRFHGWLEKPALASLFEASHVAVAPGRSAIEAMARRKPVIPLGSAGCFGLATEERLDAAAHCNFGGFGLVKEPPPARVLADLLTLAENPARRDQLGQQSRRYVEAHLDLAHHHHRLEELYLAALSASKTGT